MNPNFNWAIVAERMQALQAEADTAARARLRGSHPARDRPRPAGPPLPPGAGVRPGRLGPVAPGHHPRNHEQAMEEP